MGCDIHLHVEVKLNGKWEHAGHPSVDRWYRLFGKMAGVRTDEVKPIAEPKGLPDGLSVLTEHDAKAWDGDAHTHSWLSWGEIEALRDWLRSDCRGQSLEWDVIHMALPYRGETDFEDVRFVFWFDN